VIKATLNIEGTIGIIGMSYKPNCDYAEPSFGADLAKSLQLSGRSVLVFDPNASLLEASGVDVPVTDDFAKFLCRCEFFVSTWPERQTCISVLNARPDAAVMDLWE
jgi:UDP-glucose 6-dehydrogenase